jgi:phage terminase large subunit
MYAETTATHKVKALTKRIRIVQGGTSASKTISTLLFLIAKAQSDKRPTTTSIVSESFPHLKRGAIRDFLNIMQEHKYFKDHLWNKTDSTYTFETGSKIEFFSVDQPGKVRGPRRDRLFCNEADRINYETFDQLEVRTKEFVMLDYNPTAEFWAQTELVAKRTDVEFIILTYKDNEALDASIVAAIEQRQNNKSWWRVYGLGLLGEVEGRIYKGWTQIDEVPQEAKLLRRWLDYGYSNDPTASGDVYKWNDAYVLDEQIYQKGLHNRQIADVLLNLEGNVPVASR